MYIYIIMQRFEINVYIYTRELRYGGREKNITVDSNNNYNGIQQ